jgi:hypothetical protein
VSFHPNDLIGDEDLLAYESTLEATFARDAWDDKREKALEDWLFPVLRANGYDPERLRTRYEPDQVYGQTAAVFSDLAGAATSATSDDLNLAAVFATPGTDALYIGSARSFRGISLRMVDAVSAVSGTVTVSYWADGWRPLIVSDALTVGGVPFARGGAFTWRVPSGWVKRAVNGGASAYFVRVTVTATPTSAKVGQIGVIRRSVLSAPAVYRALALIMREAPTSQDGPWAAKAQWYEGEADAALTRALQSVAGEFDTDTSDQVSQAESEQTTEEAGGRGGWSFER